MDINEVWCKLFLLIGFIFVENIEGYPSGAPPAQCVDGFPFHGVPPKTNPPPYKIILGETTYNGGDIIQIAIQATKVPDIVGFAIHVRPLNGDGRAVGKFTSYDPTHVQGYSVHAYNEIDINCLTHVAPTRKRRLVFQYLTPSPSLGDLEVLTTFVKDIAGFWPRVRMIITARQPAVAPFPPVPISTNIQVPNFDECGKTQGCFLYPRDCSGLDCRYALTYKLSVDGRRMNFEAMGVTPGYITMGFSADDKMGTDETVTCMNTLNQRSVQHGFNLGRCNERQPMIHLSDLAVSRSGDKVFCKWSRPLQVVLRSYYNMSCKNGDRYDKGHARFEFDFNVISYKLFVARGTMFAGTDVMKKHDQLPIISEEKIDFQSIKTQYGWQLPIFIKCHAVLAIVAWLGLIAVSITTGRHFQTSLLRLSCGKPLWFQIHVAFNVIGILIMGGCIALMMLYLKEYNFLKMELYYLIHGGLGLVATGVGVLQIIIGICRPSRNTSRSCWHGMHTIFGILAMLAACASIMMGANMDALEVWLRTRLTLMLGIYIGYIFLWNVILEIIRCILAKRKTGGGASIEETAEKPSTSKAGTYAYYVIYVMILLGSAVLLFLTLSFIGMA